MVKNLYRIANGIPAGIVVSIGGAAFLACCGENRIAASFLFSVALLCVCLKGYSLYTGKIGFIPEKHDREAVSVLLCGLLGNLIATVVCGVALRYAIPNLFGAAESLCAAKLAQSWWQTLIRAAFCGILMYLAVSIYRDKKTISAMLFCVPAFILAGFEHSVANVFYFSVSGALFSVRSLVYLAVVVLGNSLGAMMMCWFSMIQPKSN